MTPEDVETIAQMLYELDRELDRQKGVRAPRWDTDAETQRNRYRLRARRLLAVEDFASLITRLDHQHRRAKRLIQSGC
jgi:hypothetical protein